MDHYFAKKQTINDHLKDRRDKWARKYFLNIQHMSVQCSKSSEEMYLYMKEHRHIPTLN